MALATKATRKLATLHRVCVVEVERQLYRTHCPQLILLWDNTLLWRILTLWETLV